MVNLKIDKIKSLQISDKDTLEPIVEFGDIGNATIESEIELSSLSKEKISLNHEASFEASFKCESKGWSSLFGCTTDSNNKPYCVEYNIPILVQARWHKKNRINKKWLKRYGMKKDKMLVQADVDSFGQDTSQEPYDLIKSQELYPLIKTECAEFNMALSNMRWKFRPDQLRRNLKIEPYVLWGVK